MSLLCHAAPHPCCNGGAGGEVGGGWRRWVGVCLGERHAAPGGQLVCHLSLLSFAKPKCKNELKKT